MLRGVRFAAVVPIAAGVFVIAAIGLGYLMLDLAGREVSAFAFTWADRARWFALVATGVLTFAWMSPVLGGILRRLIRG